MPPSPPSALPALLPPALLILALTLVIPCTGSAAEPAPMPVKILSQPVHAGRVRPTLFGNFIELLDDLVPGMWAEMLNDRRFEGVVPRSSWCYYDGEPNVCDREWTLQAARYQSEGAFNGSRCVELSGSDSHPARLRQSGLALRAGQRYRFAGYFRAGSPSQLRLELKTLLPGGRRAVLAAAQIRVAPGDWRRCTAELAAHGASDDVTFEVSAPGTVLADDLSLMPEDNRDGWRSDVVEAIREAHPALIRWGGSVVDPGGYRWRDGTGPRDRRTPFANRVWGRIDPNDVGIDEFCRFCELVGAEPLVCVSRQEGPQSAAELVEYCNGGSDTAGGARRAANGHPQPYRVRYWQIGNEVAAQDDARIRECLEFCRAIHRADSEARVLTSYPSPELMRAVGPEVAYVAPHHYTRDLAACDAELRRLSELTRTLPGCEHVRGAVTEWNVTGGEWGLERGRQLTLDTALRNARYLNLLIRRCDFVEIACRSNMANSLCSGIIATRPGGLYRRPSYYVMKLYAENALPVPLTLEGAPEGVDLVACAAEDHRTVCLFAVNRRSQPVDLALTLDGFSGAPREIAGESLRDTLDLRQTDALNNWAYPERVRTMPLAARGIQVVLPALSASAVRLSF